MLVALAARKPRRRYGEGRASVRSCGRRVSAGVVDRRDAAHRAGFHPAETGELARPVVAREARADPNEQLADDRAEGRVLVRAPRPTLKVSRQPVGAGGAAQVVDPCRRCLLGNPWVHSHIDIFA